MDMAHLVLFVVTTLTELSWQGVAARVAGHVHTVCLVGGCFLWLFI